jgi:hypothetical protein
MFYLGKEKLKTHGVALAPKQSASFCAFFPGSFRKTVL